MESGGGGGNVPEDANDRKKFPAARAEFLCLEVFRDPLLIGSAFAADCPGTQSEARAGCPQTSRSAPPRPRVLT